MSRYTKTDQAEARDRLATILPKGSTLYSILRSVSRSGMSRQFSFYAIANNQPVFLTYSIAVLLGYPVTKSGPLTARVDGCGMDMAFHTAHRLSRVLHQEDYAIKSAIL